MRQPQVLPVEELVRGPYVTLLCYPYPDRQEAEARATELRGIGVEALEIAGGVLAAGIPVLGKGHDGVVVTAIAGGERLALKIRRLDGSGRGHSHEAAMLTAANSAGVGPAFVAATQNFLLTQLIDGGTLAGWMGRNRAEAEYRRAIGDVLEQCWRLDEAGMDHGELSNAPRHLLADTAGKPFIVDFEAASLQRRASNVTSVCQYLFMGNSSARELIWDVLGERDRRRITEASREYKKDRSRSRFEALLESF
ncbi:MAG: hypothetical protein FWH47_07430 [Methanomassiliicoccaceae archaeon]|nr:hypothetical protein [Methanomassiliicoccaceae archaeon]